MKDAIVAEHSSTDNQTVSATIFAAQNQEVLPPQRDALGRLLPGHKVGVGNSAGKGLAKVSCLVEEILDKETMADVDYALENGRAQGLPLRKLKAYNRVRDYIYNDGAAADRIEGVIANKHEHSGKDGAPIAVVTADCTDLLVTALTKKE